MKAQLVVLSFVASVFLTGNSAAQESDPSGEIEAISIDPNDVAPPEELLGASYWELSKAGLGVPLPPRGGQFGSNGAQVFSGTAYNVQVEFVPEKRIISRTISGKPMIVGSMSVALLFKKKSGIALEDVEIDQWLSRSSSNNGSWKDESEQQFRGTNRFKPDGTPESSRPINSDRIWKFYDTTTQEGVSKATAFAHYNVGLKVLTIYNVQRWSPDFSLRYFYAEEDGEQKSISDEEAKLIAGWMKQASPLPDMISDSIFFPLNDPSSRWRYGMGELAYRDGYQAMLARGGSQRIFGDLEAENAMLRELLRDLLKGEGSNVAGDPPKPPQEAVKDK